MDHPTPQAVSDKERPGRITVRGLDARAKILATIGFTVVVVTTPAQAVWAFMLYAAILVFLFAMARVPVRYILKRALLVLPFVLVVAAFVPFFHQAGSGSYSLGDLRVTDQGLLVLWNAGIKALLGVMSMTFLGATTSFAETIAGFQRLRAPNVLVLTVSFMYRYSFVLVEESQRMRRAMTSRNFRARWLGNVPVLGHMLGSLFLRSYSRGERVYVAMLSRGYSGAIDLGLRTSLGPGEYGFLTALLILTVAIRVGASLWGAV